jgi:hypothetical protein
MIIYLSRSMISVFELNQSAEVTLCYRCTTLPADAVEACGVGLTTVKRTVSEGSSNCNAKIVVTIITDK